MALAASIRSSAQQNSQRKIQGELQLESEK
jgi:hypothetical protein